MIVHDSSALLAFLQGEDGATTVENELPRSFVSSANWSEVAQKVSARGADWEIARTLLLSYDISIEPVTLVDAEEAARLWQPNSELSLADRLCLALTDRLNARVLTADRAWGESDRIQQIH